MSQKLVQQAKVKTNLTKGSICSIDVQAVTFKSLWDNYVTGSPYDDPSKTHSNQCAIRMSATLHKVGVEMKSFSQKTVKPEAGKESIGRILLNGKATSTRADEMASWLKQQPFCGLPKEPENITGKDWESKVKDRTGIIFFGGYWTREGEEGAGASGGHIDLWNGSRLTNNGTLGTVETFMRFRLGIHRPWPRVYSDLRASKTILFFEIK
ncbi:type VI secretion system amidase effector protein Tae4 [Iodobacter sp.]|uniref:type VI secretion system amidase effector protein Tae4 n=1 Tax=Iodobacter sp. TaxID=1915058 RepID=UPI0025F65C69|nr:type VI secretion system amidase effector protein Tae4 [Iodobacter sp.]